MCVLLLLRTGRGQPVTILPGGVLVAVFKSAQPPSSPRLPRAQFCPQYPQLIYRESGMFAPGRVFLEPGAEGGNGESFIRLEELLFEVVSSFAITSVHALLSLTSCHAQPPQWRIRRLSCSHKQTQSSEANSNSTTLPSAPLSYHVSKDC